MKRAPVIPKHTLNTQPVDRYFVIDTSCPDGGFVNCARRSNGVAVMPLLCLYVVGM